MLQYADTVNVLTTFGEQHEQPKNKTDTLVFRRVKPYNANANETPNITASNFVLSEGTYPTPATIDFTDVTVVLQQYGILFKYSDKTADMYEDDIPAKMQEQTGRTLAEVCELVAFGQMKGGTTVQYTNGSSRAAVNTTIDINDFRQMARTLENNRAGRVTKRIAAGPNFDTSPVDSCFIVFLHTDMEADVRRLTDFNPVYKYGSAFDRVHDREIGACEQFRFVTSPLFAPWLASGSATLNGMKSAGSANVDIYPIIVIGEDAMGHVSLKGNGPGKGKTGIKPRIVPHDHITHSNPLGTFGYVGANFWYACSRLNENWMGHIESGATDL
jgi:N4-gp56 family major capsid protein